MSSPLGLGNISETFVRGTAQFRYDSVNQNWSPTGNSNYQQSLFNDGASLSYFPKSSDPSNIKNLEREIISVNTSPHGTTGTLGTDSDNIYDLRTQSILDWSQKQSNAMMLYAKDFAYLRYLGVYPNNRLIIC